MFDTVGSLLSRAAPVLSQSLHEAFGQPYRNNASLNAARADVAVPVLGEEGLIEDLPVAVGPGFIAPS